MAPRALMDFAGQWSVLRRIDDRHAGVLGTFRGIVDFVTDGPGLTCTETGLLHYGDAPPMQGARRTLWRSAGPGRIAVLHEDGRAFHAFDLGPQATAVHDCAPDLYRVAYDFAGWPDWSAIWTVSGPRKNYTSESRFLRGLVQELSD